MSEFNNVYYNGTKYTPAGSLLTSDEPVTTLLNTGKTLKFSTGGDFKNTGLLLNTKDVINMKDGFSLIFDLGSTFYHSDQFGKDGMINFAFYENGLSDISTYKSYIPDHMNGCRFAKATDMGNGYTTKLFRIDENNVDQNDNYGFAIAFFYDSSNTSMNPVIDKFQLVIKRKEYNGLVEDHIVDTYAKTLCYSDTLPFSVDLAKPCNLSVVRNRGMIKIYLNGIWITEFYIGDDEVTENLFNNGMYMSIYSVGTVTSISEITLHSVNGIAAAEYFSDNREYIEIFNKLTFREKFTELTNLEIDKLLELSETESNYEMYWQNEALLQKLLEWYEENKEEN